MLNFKKSANSFRHAFRGIFDVILHGNNMRIHLLAAILVLITGFVCKLNNIEWAIILLCIFLVLAAETFNSAIEYAIDLISPSHHDLAKKAKDAAAGAVLLVAILSLLIAAIILLPKLLKLL